MTLCRFVTRRVFFIVLFNCIYVAVELFRFGRELAKKHNGIYRFWCFPLGAVFIYNPDDVEVSG